ncbi:hypothetical protein HOLleu_28262 [Holothuria leucospilota]|uniref:Uncharacterized protein n=1 Tax=Holothuria leucospilota TaxID=206669 RepID=A0A9Q1BLQ7_HOLLE|nr:hypothetical protein HOLleu_28262 [Holothuria leucospilota]
MATVDGQFEYSSTGNILKRILNSNKSSEPLKSRTNLFGNKLVDTQSSHFVDQTHDESMHTLYTTAHQQTAGPSTNNRPNQREGRFTVAGGVSNHGFRERMGGRNYVCNDINGTETSYGSLDPSGVSSSPRAHSQFDQNDIMDGASNNSSFQSEFLNISEGIDLDSLTPANLCRLSFVDLANLTIVSLVQLQKYGQIILNLQQEVSVLKEEIDNLKGSQPQNSKKQSTNCARESLSNAAENFQKLDAMLEKLTSGRVRDCVECIYSEESNRKSSYACRVCWRGLHRSPTCVYKHRCLKTLVRDLGLSNDAEDFDNDDGSSAYNDYGNFDNGDLYNGLDDTMEFASDSPMMSNETHAATSKSIPTKRKKAVENILPNKAIKKPNFGNGRVDAIFTHCIKKMDAGSRRECSACSNRKAGKRQRSRYMCAKCGRGLHSRGTCITVHPCWKDEFKGWEQGKEFKRSPEIVVGPDLDVTPDILEEAGEIDVKQEDNSESEVNLEVVAVGIGDDDEEVEQIQPEVELVNQDLTTGGGNRASPRTRRRSALQLNEENAGQNMTDQELRREVQKEFQAEVANVLKVLDEN